MKVIEVLKVTCCPKCSRCRQFLQFPPPLPPASGELQVKSIECIERDDQPSIDVLKVPEAIDPLSPPPPSNMPPTISLFPIPLCRYSTSWRIRGIEGIESNYPPTYATSNTFNSSKFVRVGGSAGLEGRPSPHSNAFNPLPQFLQVRPSWRN